MKAAGTDKDWNRFARQCPYFAVCTDDRFRTGNFDDAARREFFSSGEQHVDHLLEMIRTHVAAGFTPRRALDFGCGVGRIVLPLSRHCEEVVGVDVADAMLRLASEHCQRSNVANVRLVKGDDRLSAVTGRFDLIHSHIVFQHIPVKRGLALLDRLLEMLATGGIGVLHFVFDSVPARQSWDRARPWRGRLKRLLGPLLVLYRMLWPRMQMNDYPLAVVLRRLFDVGARRMWTEMTDHDGHRGLILYFQKDAPR
jgi:SAM-dependent methyltransferase